MDSLSHRCRHEQVKWVGPNRCKCNGCRKTGHWFEKAGLVMWCRGEAQTNAIDTTLASAFPKSELERQAS